MSRLGIIDTHAHLDDGRFAVDRQEVLERLGRDMEAVITQGTDYESSRLAVALSEQYDFIYAAVGWHPGDLAGIRDESYIGGWSNWPVSMKKWWPSGKSAWIITGKKTSPGRSSCCV